MTAVTPRKRDRPSGLILGAFAGLLALPSAGPAQQPGPPVLGREYVRLPVDGDLEAMLRDKLQTAQGRHDLERLLKDLAQRKGPLSLTEDQIDKLRSGTGDPALRDQVKKALNRYKMDPKALEAFKRTVEQFQKQQAGKELPTDAAGHQDQPRTDRSQEAQPPTPRPQPPAEDKPAPAEDAFADWLRQRMQNLEHSRVGEVLRHSPAFRRGLMELQESFLRHRERISSRWQPSLGKFVSGVRLPDWDLSGLRGGWAKVRGLRLPSLPRPSLPVGRLGGGWRLGSPSASGAGLGQVLLWVGLLVAGGWLLWQITARLKAQDRGDGRAGWRIGPWPVDPAQVASRAELVQAFDHLALLMLGPAALPRHHLAVADGLAGAGPDATRRQNAAAELAALYEQARYAPEQAPLSAEELTAARRDLCLLAGVTRP